MSDDIPGAVLLTVEPDDREAFAGHFAVVPHKSEREEHGRPILRSFPSKAAAWHMACMRGYERNGTLPALSPGGMFPAEGGWTHDPRFANEVEDRGSLTPAQIKATENAVIEFIRKRIGDHMSDDQQTTETTEQDWEYPEPEGRPTEDSDPMPEPEPEAKPKRKRKTKAEREAEKAADAHESDSESLSDDSGASAQPETSEPAESVSEPEVPEQDQHAYNNFAALADSAPSEAGREFWRGKANALVK